MSDTLDLDCGNTRLKYRFGKQRGSASYADGVPRVAAPAGVARIRISSVLGPQRSEEIGQQLGAMYDADCQYAVSQQACAGVVNGYRDPGTMGVDRWLAVLAAYNRFGAAVVVDLGTAATFDYVNDQGMHLGGYIIPGLQLMQRSLLENTAEVRPEIATNLTDLPLGTSTHAAVSHGAMVTIVRLIEAELVRARQLCHHSATLVLCGGDSQAIAQHLRCPYQIVTDLVLDGLNYALP